MFYVISDIQNHERHPYGVRGRTMVLLGVVWVLMGLGVLLNATMPPVDGAFHYYIPAPVRGALWIASGLVAIATARGLRSSDLGLGLLIFMPALRAISFTWAWIEWLVPDQTDDACSAGVPLWSSTCRWAHHAAFENHPGAANAWYQVVFYVVMLAFVANAMKVPSHQTGVLIGVTPPVPGGVDNPEGE